MIDTPAFYSTADSRVGADDAVDADADAIEGVEIPREILDGYCDLMSRSCPGDIAERASDILRRASLLSPADLVEQLSGLIGSPQVADMFRGSCRKLATSSTVVSGAALGIGLRMNDALAVGNSPYSDVGSPSGPQRLMGTGASFEYYAWAIPQQVINSLAKIVFDTLLSDSNTITKGLEIGLIVSTIVANFIVCLVVDAYIAGPGTLEYWGYNAINSSIQLLTYIITKATGKKFGEGAGTVTDTAAIQGVVPLVGGELF